MCGYNQASRAAVRSLPGPLTQADRYLGQPAHHKLLQAVASGRARPGHDLYDGRSLPNGSLQRGHYMSPLNFQRSLTRMNAQPGRCQWCGGPLPAGLIREHQKPHDHREHIQHHFHPECWRARLLAVAAIFGHVSPEQLLAHGAQRRRSRLRETITVTIKKVFTWNGRPRIQKCWKRQ